MRRMSLFEGREGSRIARELLILLFFSSLMSCSVWSPMERHREDRLRMDLRSFHWALIGQDVPVALQYVPTHARNAWDDSFTCLFEGFRFTDYRVELVKLGSELSEATVRVRCSLHPKDSLVVKEWMWTELWSFNATKQRWSLSDVPDALKGLPAACIPDLPEKEKAPAD